MSLRDQLLKAGLASKKDVTKANRQKKEERKAQQGARERKSKLRREAEARQQAELEAKRLARAQARKAREDEQEARERPRRIRQIVRSNAVRGRGRVPFWVKGADGRTLHRLSVSDGVARKLRAGELGVALAPAVAGQDEELVVIGLDAVRRLRDVAPDAVRFFVDDNSGIDAADEQFLDADWEISLRPHRVSGEAGPR